MKRLFLTLATTAAVGGLLCANAGFAQILPPAKKAGHVEITQGPSVELARADLVILRWTTNNPGGSDEHFAVAYYGADPEHLTETAKSHIRLNQNHPETMFRVRLDHLKPLTTYYYKVTSMDEGGKSDGEESPVSHFTTPALGEMKEAYPQPE
jgi:phosphodiesterase/alkaline phosphatase D-like protein